MAGLVYDGADFSLKVHLGTTADSGGMGGTGSRPWWMKTAAEGTRGTVSPHQDQDFFEIPNS
jgi:hypothetical protein